MTFLFARKKVADSISSLSAFRLISFRENSVQTRPLRFKQRQTKQSKSIPSAGLWKWPLPLHRSTSSSAFAPVGVDSTFETLEENEIVSSPQKSHHEDWMRNLGRKNDNGWLLGKRKGNWYTGVHPLHCPGVDKSGVIRSISSPDLSVVTRQCVRDYFNNSWTLFETLFAGLNTEEAFYRPPLHGLRHPHIFYYGHTACLYVNKLRVAEVLSGPVNEYFEKIFEVGVDEMLWDDMNKNDMLWPAVSEVHNYRRNVYSTILDIIDNHPLLDDNDGPISVDQNHPMWALFMSIEHERIHFETSSVLFRETPIHLVQTPEHWPPMHPSSESKSTNSNPTEGSQYPENRMIPVDSATVALGKPKTFPSFGWDNEYGERTVHVPQFLASENLVTNGEFWQFVSDGGYWNSENWCKDGWSWRCFRNLKWPAFWEAVGPQGAHEFSLRTIFKVIPMQWDWPVDVNYYEAKAFCKWKTLRDGSPTSQSFRILTEAEHHLLRHEDHSTDSARLSASADKVTVTDGADFSRGKTGSNLNMAFSSQSPVTSFPPSNTGHRDVFGNVWEWTEDHFNPLTGFEVHRVYDDFSTPCFDGKHNMIMGGSFISTGDEASIFARFHFRPHFLQHSGFRLVASDSVAPAMKLVSGTYVHETGDNEQQQLSTPTGSDSEETNVYETDDLLNMYLGMHFSDSGLQEGVDPILSHDLSPAHGLKFPQRVVELLCALKPERTNNRALDIGCSVGGASFELAKSFDQVEAFDYSETFIDSAKKMQQGEDVYFNVPIEADICKKVKAVHNGGVQSSSMRNIHFFVGDACKLGEYATNPAFGTFDGVVLSNLLCRLPDPIACLDGLPHIVNRGGIVVIVTPFSWMEAFTPQNKWLGGMYDSGSGAPIFSADRLCHLMTERGFEKVHDQEMPLVIREHQRKYQYIVSQATGWRRTGDTSQAKITPKNVLS